MARSDYPNGSEIITCHKCGIEKDLYYDQYDIVISETKCNCNKNNIPGMKPLDMAFIKLREVLNERHKKS